MFLSCTFLSIKKPFVLFLIVIQFVSFNSCCNFGLGNFGVGNVGFLNFGVGNKGFLNTGVANVGAFNLGIRTIGAGNAGTVNTISVANIGGPNITPLVGRRKKRSALFSSKNKTGQTPVV